MNDDNGSQAAKSNKIKSQKLLCLWPLPIMTRYFIAISLFLSTLSTFGFLRFTCSSPSYVIYRHDIANLLLSPFIFSGSLHALLLFGWNVLILGLFEESLAHMLGGTRRFVQVLFCMFLAVAGLRQAIGYLFSKSTGWAVPSLFFSNALHECNQGIAPFLFSLLVVQSLSIDDKYILMYGNDDTNHKVTVRKVTLQLFMCMVNYAGKNILWWSLTGLLVGYMAMLAIQASLARDKKHQHDINDVSEFIKVEHYRRTPLWRLLWTAVKQGTALVLVTLPLLFICNQYYTREVLVDPAVLNQITHDRYLFSFVIMTAPRRGNPAFLSRTLESYLTNWPVNPEPGSLYDRMQMLVYTHFTNHTQYDVARHNYADDSRGRHYLKWIREDGNLLNQRAHVSKALSLAADQYQSTYIALVEDDFPVCGSREWRHIESVIYAANQQVPGHCGVFVGTGGSGLFMKPKIAKLASGLLLKYNDMPPDIILQKCLMGDLPECGECSQTLVTSKTLLMYHIGFNTSTSQDRSYKKDEFQCGWRHPFVSIKTCPRREPQTNIDV
ncbi:uncharacterized protein BYT42DRAFT_505407 [Radiomyces spectabilis]|uniref:uncharacterized protein n=1 Tax=Radiomyces spectabilis TaxID=64574 RepID=UPI002220888C|nr:uncharacterized protein BYT42DRAFT_505407 [Radiomyces spectabilis]KAI8366000.1 hypothetical protein BYT42DRAFT_505407 [Radiomyces spectabilis]